MHAFTQRVFGAVSEVARRPMQFCFYYSDSAKIGPPEIGRRGYGTAPIIANAHPVFAKPRAEDLPGTIWRVTFDNSSGPNLPALFAENP
jgi:hypothetical protein